MLISFWLVFALIGVCQETAQARWLRYPQSVFDSDTCCWRTLASHGSYQEAATLIKMFLHENHDIPNKHSLHWHLGQMLAKAGETKEAIRYFKKTYNGFYSMLGGRDGKTWYCYAKGTVAFLERDKNELLRMIDKWPNENFQDLNYNMLQTLLNNWNLSYEDATRT